MKFNLFPLVIFAALAGCLETTEVQNTSAPVASKAKQSEPATRAPSASAVQAYASVAAQVQPVARAVCRKAKGLRCNFIFAIDDRADMPANAFQTVNDAGRPVIIFTTKLLETVRNKDELAFILAHEAAHHVLGHLDTKNDSAILRGMSAKVDAVASGKNEKAVEEAWKRGVRDGILVYSKAFELEADVLGARITEQAGFDALKGALYFNSIRDPGNRVYSTHPRNADRLRAVRAEVARIRGG